MIAQQLAAQPAMSAINQQDAIQCRIYVGSIGYDLNEEMIRQVRGAVGAQPQTLLADVTFRLSVLFRLSLPLVPSPRSTCLS
jgi:hypothetical protein